ncbi:hypothetical protein H312_00250, partial [Anncaliia algerae PRA339]
MFYFLSICVIFLIYHLFKILFYLLLLLMKSKYKIVFLGEQGVGKSTLISQFVYRCIEDKYQPTIGIDFLPKKIDVDGKEIKLQIWDTAGQEKFNSIISSYARDSFIAVIVYDVIRGKSFDSIDKCINELVKKYDREDKIKLLIVANKIDLVDESELEKYKLEGESKAKEFNAAFLTTSAKTYEGIKCMEDYFIKEVRLDLATYSETEESFNSEKEPKSRC